MNLKRARIINEGKARTGPVVYWMSRDQRVKDNWALLFAQKRALEHKAPLAIVFCLVPSFLNASMRQYGFMIKGLKEVEAALRKKRISVQLLTGDPAEEIPKFLFRMKAGTLVTDFDPLRIKRKWKSDVSTKITIPFYEVDAHNIVPCWIASPKQEYAVLILADPARQEQPHKDRQLKGGSNRKEAKDE